MINSIIDLSIKGDERGSLIALESEQEIPFDIKRVFYVYGTQKGISRGNHAHHKTKEFLVAVSGSCRVILDNGKGKIAYDLNKPNIGLFKDKLIWITMDNFSEDCVLLVLCDVYYDESDYIMEYDKFLEIVNNDS